MSPSLRTKVWALPMAGLLFIGACSDSHTTAVESEPVLTESLQHTLGQGRDAHQSMDTREWLRGVREATRAFKDFDAAASGGYADRVSPCVESPAGGMGYHIANLALFDTELDPLRPELLLYEPRQNGELRFVGVEFVVPIVAWQSEDPPTVRGMELHRNDDVGLWALHMWTERHNPTGLFEDFNPKVSCEFATDGPN